MRIFGFITALLLIMTIFLRVASPVFAQADDSSMKNIACNSLADPEKGECLSCMGGESNTGTWTAIGCITTDPNALLVKIISLAMGVAGGIAFLLILFGGLQILTSAGNPEQLNAGRELVSSAITGLLLIIFSIFILQFIGVNIIGIPGFG